MAVFSWDSGHCLFFWGGDDACRSGLRLGFCASCWRSPVRSQFASIVTDNQEEIASVACRRFFFFRTGAVRIPQHLQSPSVSAFRKTFGVPRQRPLQSSVEDRRWLRVCSLCQNRIFFLRFCSDQPPSFSPETRWRWSDAAPSFARTCVSSTRIQCGTPPPLIMKRFSQSVEYVERRSVAQWDGLYSTISLWLPSARH